MQTICYQRGTILSEEIKNKIKNKIFNQINNEHEFNKITTELKLKYADAERLQRNEKPSKKLNKDIKSLEENIVKNVKTTQKNKTELYLQMNKLYHDFWSDDPTQAIETFNAKTPIILFPIRLEIKYCTLLFQIVSVCRHLVLILTKKFYHDILLIDLILLA